ncbi:hypothetical protein PG996_005326 [Apiospora saccharicola]|uniref:Uncharacterized protein n=1 Tax=Apiospora saccharicola TaxID=335842 RepID=A0ABR1VL98_9PEZI
MDVEVATENELHGGLMALLAYDPDDPYNYNAEKANQGRQSSGEHDVVTTEDEAPLPPLVESVRCQDRQLGIMLGNLSGSGANRTVTYTRPGNIRVTDRLQLFPELPVALGSRPMDHIMIRLGERKLGPIMMVLRIVYYRCVLAKGRRDLVEVAHVPPSLDRAVLWHLAGFDARVDGLPDVVDDVLTLGQAEVRLRLVVPIGRLQD